MPPVPCVSSLHFAHVAVPKSEHMLLLFGRHGHVMPFDCSQGTGELRKQPVFWTENRNDDQKPPFPPVSRVLRDSVGHLLTVFEKRGILGGIARFLV